MTTSDTFYITEGNTAPSLRRQLLNSDGTAIDLSAASSVVFRMATQFYDTLAEGACAITDAANGWVQYDWQAGDTDQQGTHRAEFIVTYADGGVQTVPANGGMIVEIDRAIGPKA